VSARVIALVVASALVAAPLAAQRPRFSGADGTLYRVKFRSTFPGGSESLSGFAVGAQSRFERGRLGLELALAEGRLAVDEGSATPRSLVEGSLALTVQATPWLALTAGPHLRAYVTPAGTERWVRWQTGARGAGSIIPGVLDVHVAGWLALASSVNAEPGASGTRGGEAGLTLRIARWPVSFRLAYAVDQADFASDVRRETLESVYLGVTYTRR
jgi:hypothetical protein